MSRSLLVLVTDEFSMTEQVKETSEKLGVPVKVFSTGQWAEGLDNQFFRNQLALRETPYLPGEMLGDTTETKILAFPVNGQRASTVVAKMDQIEAQAIENAILQCRGNLTEASKALGIGRATLYRKVKLYQIDPSMARKKRAA